MFDSHFISIFHLNRLPNTTSCLLSGFFLSVAKPRFVNAVGPAGNLVCSCCARVVLHKGNPETLEARGGRASPCTLPGVSSQCRTGDADGAQLGATGWAGQSEGAQGRAGMLTS